MWDRTVCLLRYCIMTSPWHVVHRVLYRSRAVVHSYGSQTLETPLGYAHLDKQSLEF